MPPPTAQSEHNPSPTERLGLAELELARVLAACVYDNCGPDCLIRASVLASVESDRDHLAHLPEEAAPAATLEIAS